jgi:hypothetical protein
MTDNSQTDGVVVQSILRYIPASITEMTDKVSHKETPVMTDKFRIYLFPQ